MAIPLKNPIIKKVRFPAELTAANESLSAKFPTTHGKTAAIAGLKIME